jgi:4-amino-4-deoxy-L-arabinose transferase-like glycosyltransferase
MVPKKTKIAADGNDGKRADSNVKFREERMRNNRQVKKQHNQGFSLFTVIIAVSFVGILGLLILYIALSNFQMKVTDLKGNPLLLFINAWSVGMTEDRNPDLILTEFSK